jgi:hypothetical protein
LYADWGDNILYRYDAATNPTQLHPAEIQLQNEDRIVNPEIALKSGENSLTL